MNFAQLTRSCLYNWLGYGNINGRIWFIGTEEGGAEIWRQQTKTIEESLQLRSHFTLSMDFRTVWEDLYGIPLESFKGPCVWRYMAAFLLSYSGSEVNTGSVNSFVFNQKLLGTAGSDHFLCELLPLPKRTKSSIDDYKTVWETINAYHKEVIPRRFELIRDALIINTGVQLVLSYEQLLTEKVLENFECEMVQDWSHNKEEYRLYKLFLTHNRAIYLLSTPFFGNGRISYQGIKLAAENMKK